MDNVFKLVTDKEYCIPFREEESSQQEILIEVLGEDICDTQGTLTRCVIDDLIVDVRGYISVRKNDDSLSCMVLNNQNGGSYCS